jgi:hypothetical protein
VEESVKDAYYWFFSLQLIAGAIYIIAFHTLTVVATLQALAALSITVAAASLVEAEGLRLVMVLATSFARWLEGRQARRIEKAVKERDEKWERWIARKEEAERNGGGFNEPPPSRSK